MFILGQLFSSLALLFSMLFNVIYFLLVIRIILSWFPVNQYSEIVQLLYRITDPILAPFRRIPLRMGMIDFSPIFAFLAIAFLRNFIVGILTQLAYKFG
jgi:YggT family protein